MHLKPIDELKPGDVLAESLTNAQGAVLIKAGTAIQDGHLRLLRVWGVDTVKVDDGLGAEGPMLDEAALDAAEAEIKRRFGASLDNEVMAEILRVAVEQHAAKCLSVKGRAHG